MRAPLCILVACAGLAAACSSSSPPSDGGGAAAAFAVKDQLALRSSLVDDTLYIHLASLPGLCSLYQTKAQAPSRDYDIIVVEFHAPSGQLTTGVKTIVQPSGMGGTYTATQGSAFYTGNRSCNTRYGGFATGTLTISALDAAHVAGTYDLSFATGWPYGEKCCSGRIQGSFDAPVCDPMTNLPAVTCN